MPSAALAQAVSPAEREALVRLRTDRGGKPEDVDVLLKRADAAAAAGLPAGPLVNKIREGLAKGYEPARIDAVVQQMVGQLAAADTALGVRAALPAAGRDAAVALLAEAIAGGVTPGDIAELRRQVQPSGTALTAEGVANAAKALSYIRSASLPVADGLPVLAEAARRGYRSDELVDVGRLIKRREADYRSGRSSLRALRDAIARGERPEQILPDARTTSVERPAATRPRPVERPQPVERPPAPERPEISRPERPERPEAPERPGTTR